MTKKTNISKLILLSLVFLFCFQGVSQAINHKGKIGININYPGVGIRYGLSDKTSGEIKAQTGDNILATGLRVYKYMSEKSKVILFFGVEADHISFEGQNSKGTGYAIGAFVGGESFVSSSLGISIDIGAMNINLTDDATSVGVDGIEPVINIGINLYLGGGK